MNVIRSLLFLVICLQPFFFGSLVVSAETACQTLDRELAVLENPYARAGAKSSEYLEKIMQGEMKLRQARIDKNIDEQKRAIKDLVQLYEADGRPMEAVWTLRSLGRSEYADKLVAQIEGSLREAKVASSRKLGGGITETVLVTLENGLQAVFKPDDTVTSKWASNYRYEIAAYKIDEILGLNLVPVTVEATIEDRVGSLQYFVRNAKMGGDVSEDLKLFDYLIANRDRHGGNYLTRVGWQIVAIDHGITFGNVVSNPDIALISNRRIFEKLKNISVERLEKEVRPLLTGSSGADQFKPLMERIAAIVKVADEAIADRGIEAVFTP